MGKWGLLLAAVYNLMGVIQKWERQEISRKLELWLERKMVAEQMCQRGCRMTEGGRGSDRMSGGRRPRGCAEPGAPQ